MWAKRALQADGGPQRGAAAAGSEGLGSSRASEATSLSVAACRMRGVEPKTGGETNRKRLKTTVSRGTGTFFLNYFACVQHGLQYKHCKFVQCFHLAKMQLQRLKHLFELALLFTISFETNIHRPLLKPFCVRDPLSIFLT
jgi:hypothetical protein